jgi:hypothetical protein
LRASSLVEGIGDFFETDDPPDADPAIPDQVRGPNA